MASALALAMEIKNKRKVEKAPDYSKYSDMREKEVDWSEYFDPVCDDADGSVWDPVLVEEGEKKEMETFKRRKVYEYVLRGTMERNSNEKMIGVRWVRVNKGTVEDPQIRCRLVAQEFARGETRDDLFAATPPLFAMKSIISDVATNVNSADPKCLMRIDVTAAFFLYGETERELYIELPRRDPRAGSKRCVAKLKKAMCGTRDAPRCGMGRLRQL